MPAQHISLYDILRRNAFVFGSRPVMTQGGPARTYSEFLESVDALAAGLHEQGIARGDRICILAQNHPQYLVLYGACAKLGIVAYPINWRLTGQEIARVVDRAQPKMLVIDESTHATVADWPESRPGVRHWRAFAGSALGAYRPLVELYRRGVHMDPAARIEDPFAIISTAAVDVIPRGAVITHGNVLASNVQTMAALGLTENDAYLAALPMYHIAALGFILAVMHAGGKIVLMPRFDAAEALRLIDSEQVTLFSDFPPVLLSILNEAEKANSRMPSLRIVAGLDQPDTIERLHKLSSAQFWTGFGQSETSGFVTLQPYSERPGAAGRPAALCELRIVDDYDRDVPIGQPGEILVRGPVVFQGYYAQDEVTAYTLRGDWHHTGDIGRFDHSGYLYYVKRKAEKELIKPGGENVYPAEVETVIMELPGVSAVCVFGVIDAQWGEAIKAAVEVASTKGWTPERIIDHVASKIARFKKPKFVEFTDKLPRTPEGAVDREAVKGKWGK
jgi:long-chain acyl-CoA synthetase